MNRRHFLTRASLADGALAMPRFASAAAASTVPLGKAEHCIFMWLGGGYAQIDTFDAKPTKGDGKKVAGCCYDMIDTAIPWLVFLAIVLSLIPHDMQYGPQAALIAEAFTPRLRYSGSSLGYQLASIIAGGPAPLIATALFAAFHTGYAISWYIAACAVVSLAATALMPDYTGRDISIEYDERPAGPMGEMRRAV